MGYVEQTLADGERVILRARLHWIIFAGAAAIAVTGVAMLAAWLWRAPGGVPDHDDPLRLGFVAIEIAAVVGVARAVKRATTEIAVTTRRFVVKRGVFRRAVMEINAGQIESVVVEQSVLGRLFDYGTVVAAGTGVGIDPIRQVAAPLALRESINGIGRRPLTGAAPRTGQRSGGTGVVIGDGKFAFPVNGESHHEEILEKLAGGRREKSAHVYHAALLTPQPDNPYDPDAVAVSIRGHEVGFLPRNVAGEFVRALDAAGYDCAACEAVIVGGWETNDGDRGNFGVRLNAYRPFWFEGPERWRKQRR